MTDDTVKCVNCGHTVWSHNRTGECTDTLLDGWSSTAYPPQFPLICPCKKFELKETPNVR